MMISTGNKMYQRLLSICAIYFIAFTGWAEDQFVTSYKGTSAPADVSPCPLSCPSGMVSLFGSTASSSCVPVPVVPANARRVVFGNGPSASWSVTPTDIVLSGSTGSYQFNALQNIGVYKLYITRGGGTINHSTNLVMSVTATGGDLADTNGIGQTALTVPFTRSGPVNTWIFIGYITNSIYSPTVTFSYLSGTVDINNRWNMDAVRFEYIDACMGVANPVSIKGPLIQGQTFVNVDGILAGATNVSVYGNGILIGQTNFSTGFAAGNLQVQTTALNSGEYISAGQTLNGCVSIIPSSGPVVGGGANPTIRALLGCGQNSTNAGPIGADSFPAAVSSSYFLKGSYFTAGFASAPGPGELLIPSSDWQTITFDHSTDPAITETGASMFNTDPFCSLQSLVFSMDNGDSGPYDIYVDQIENGDTVVEDFEGYAIGTTNTLVAPATASLPNAATTYLSPPNSSLISGNTAFSGAKSCRIQWQFFNDSQIRWARVLTSGAFGGKKYPQLDTTKPITIRYMVRPVGETNFPPQISAGPENQTNNLGENATFSVMATGADLTYQWQKDGVEISGATDPSLVITNVQTSDIGTYRVIVANVLGSITSQEATLTVITPIVLTTNIPGLFNTGVDDNGNPLTDGAVDRHYLVVSGNSVTAPFAARDEAWLTNDSASAWITPTLSNMAPALVGKVTNIYRLTFDLSTVVPSTLSISGEWSSDNDGMDILVNGISTGQSLLGTNYDHFTPFTVTNGFKPGLNTLEFKIRNALNGTTKTSTGLRVRMNAVAALGGSAPVIVDPPKLFSDGGVSGLLQVVAEGSVPLSYQWRSNGVPMPGAINPGLAVANPLEASTYDVVVTNAFGVVTSSVATLVIQAMDTNPPVVAVTLPAANGRLTNVVSTFLAGTARDTNSGVAHVLYRLNGSAFQSALGTTNWHAQLSLAVGTNKVEVKALDFNGNESLVVSRTFFCVVGSPFTLSVSGDGSISNTVSAWGTPTNGAMLEVGRPYTLTAIPGAGSVLSNWTGTVVYTNVTKLTFIMQSNMTLQANFIPNPFIPVKGVYNGLFFETNVPPGITHHSAGFFTLNLNTNASFSARVVVDGDTLPFSGKFQVNGTFTKILSRDHIDKPDLSLALDLNNNELTGVFSEGSNWIAELKADRNVWGGTNQAASYTNRFTLLLPGASDALTGPPGYSYMTMSINTNGVVSAVGSMADGQTFSQSVAISEEGEWPFYAQLYKTRRIYTNFLKTTNMTVPVLGTNDAYYRGSTMGWQVFNPVPSGEISWIKTEWTNAVYPNGFVHQATAMSSIYLKPPTGTRVLEVETGTLILSEGNLATTLMRSFTNSSNNKLTITPTNQAVKLSLTTGSGLLSGSFLHPENGNSVTTIKGVILQGQKIGGGYFSGTNQTGRLLLVGDEE